MPLNRGKQRRSSLKDKEKIRIDRCAEERRKVSDLLIRRQRGSILNARRKQNLLESQQNVATGAPIIFDDQDMIAAVQGAVQTLKNSIETVEHKRHVRYLRYLLTDSEDPPIDLLLRLDAVNLLVKEVKSMEKEIQSEALWALAFLADNSPTAAESLRPHVALFVPFLEGSIGYDVAELAAWLCRSLALVFGSDERESRAVLMATTLAKLLFDCVAPDCSGDKHVVDASTTAGWALSSVIGHSAPARQALFNIPQFSLQLSNLLSAKNSRMVTEAAWLVAYLVAMDDAHLAALIQADVVTQLVKILKVYLQEESPDLQITYEVLTPILRSLGSIAVGISFEQLKEFIEHENGIVLACMSKCLSCNHRGVQKEACKALSSIAAATGGSIIDAFVRNSILDKIIRFVTNSAFDIKKEAAFVLANICFTEDAGNGDLMKLILSQDPQIIRGIVTLMQGVDVDAAKLGLDFTQLILESVADGPQRVEEADGIDALDNLQFSNIPTELQDLAAHLVDTYYGEDYGLD